MLGWLCTSWALLLPLLVPPKNVVLVVGFFMAFFGLLFSGGLAPVEYEDIYDNPAVGVFSGFVSPTRYFVEGLTVAESRCLPAQSGFTVDTDEAVNFPLDRTSFSILSLAENDAGVIEESCSGWYWGILPALLVGLTVRWLAAGAIHLSGRSMQAKSPFLKELKQLFKKLRAERPQLAFSTRKESLQSAKDSCVFAFRILKRAIVVYLLVLITIFALSVWSILRKT